METLSADRRIQLEAIGFVWDVLEAQWAEMFAQLVAYKNKNNHCNVQQRFVLILVCLVGVLYRFIANFYVSFHFLSVLGRRG